MLLGKTKIAILQYIMQSGVNNIRFIPGIGLVQICENIGAKVSKNLIFLQPSRKSKQYRQFTLNISCKEKVGIRRYLEKNMQNLFSLLFLIYSPHSFLKVFYHQNTSVFHQSQITSWSHRSYCMQIYSILSPF